MCRSCDSSFGLGVTDNDDELGWFTSDQTKGTEEALKMDFKFPCPEPSSLKHILQHQDSPESNTHRFSCISENKTELNYKDQVSPACLFCFCLFDRKIDKCSFTQLLVI